jgi:integrase
MVILGYCAGLRLGEVARLALADFRPDEGTLEVRNTTFFKSRRLPLTTSVAAEVERVLPPVQRTRDFRFSWVFLG